MFIKIGEQLINLDALASVNLDDSGEVVLCPCAAWDWGQPMTALRYSRDSEQGKRILEFFAGGGLDKWGPGAMDLTA